MFKANCSVTVLRSATTTTSHRAKTHVVFRSKSTGFEEGKLEKAPTLESHTVWEPSTGTEEQIQALATRGLLRPKTEVSWRPAVGEEFPTEGTGETVIFVTHMERGFGVPTGDFLAASSSTASMKRPLIRGD
jgi:hypothetical protein